MMRTGLVLVAVLAACSKGNSSDKGTGAGGKRGSGQKMEYPVEVAPLVVKQMQYAVTAPGSIDAYQQVQITSRVSGAVDRVGFVEGQAVKNGEVLVTIESDRYMVAVDQAKTAIAKADANEKAAEAALNRRLVAQKDSPGLVPGEEIEQKQTAVDTAKADQQAAQQALRVANLNLRDSHVTAPIAGIVQTRTVQQGQYLQPGMVLATILQRDPMLLRFQVSEQDAPRLKEGMPAILTLKESTRTFSSVIKLVGGAADPATRMVPITAQLDVTEHQYWLRPGAFCEVSVPIGDARQGIVVPSLAVEPTEQGNTVFIIKDNIAHAKIVQLGMHTPEGGVELTTGVKAGDVMVMHGIEPLSDGAPVKVSKTITVDEALKPPASQSTTPGDTGSGSAAPAPAAPAPAATGSGSGSGSGHRKKDAP